jgi:hypothetical protein
MKQDFALRTAHVFDRLTTGSTREPTCRGRARRSMQKTAAELLLEHLADRAGHIERLGT